MNEFGWKQNTFVERYRDIRNPWTEEQNSIIEGKHRNWKCYSTVETNVGEIDSSFRYASQKSKTSDPK